MADEPGITDTDDTLEFDERALGVADLSDDDIQSIRDAEPSGPAHDADALLEDEEELTVSFGEEDAADQPDDNATMRHMREELRKARAEAAELRKASAPKPIEVGPKPTLADCDFDEEEFEAALDEWKERKAQADSEASQVEERVAAVRKSWEDRNAVYQAKKAALAAPDFDECEAMVDDALGKELSPVILKAAHDPAAMVVALGRNPAKLAELGKIKDPFELTAAIARLEANVKITRGKKAPAPDRPANGSAAMPGSTDKQLEKLEKEAERTGDRTKLIAFKSKLKAK